MVMQIGRNSGYTETPPRFFGASIGRRSFSLHPSGVYEFLIGWRYLFHASHGETGFDARQTADRASERTPVKAQDAQAEPRS